MKLLYFYFDFTQNGSKPDGYRGYTTCELNFGTETQYHMATPTQDGQNYLLTQKIRPNQEKIVSGFWGDKRIYNISALVGDNGSGKSMLIHEMIRCLMTSFHKRMTFEKLEDPEYPFVFITEDTNKELYLVSSHISPKLSGSAEELKRISLPIIPNSERAITLDWGLTPPKPRKEYGVLRRSKMIYFSNAITMADKRQNDYWNYYGVTYSNGYTTNSQYISPMYDCSLVTDMSEAIKTSKSELDTLDGYLSTYFNFRSYQEARYVFDRNQRTILLQLRDTYHLPVPLLKSLKLSIINPFRINESHYSNAEAVATNVPLKNRPDNYFRSNTGKIAAVLSLNCVMAYYASKEKQSFDAVWREHTVDTESLENGDFFSDLLESCSRKYQDTASDYFKICQKYIHFIWSNTALMTDFFEFISSSVTEADSIIVEIPLGDTIDARLEEFMIRFINLTRAVSKHQYFVVYNWGLSSGESNLLHMFTKLRYALSGNIFDKEQYEDIITEDSSTNAVQSKREEKLLTTTDNQTMHDCDSVILFIDEADLTYHPEWQRQFISIITEFLPRLYTDPYYAGSGSGCKEIQVILSTHSPLMLGDFPSASVTYLRKHENGVTQIDSSRQIITFGENLYTILRDSFYLKNGTIGEFARKKIDMVLRDTAKIREEVQKENPFQDWTGKTFNDTLNRLDSHEKQTVQYLAPGIIRGKLEEEINNCHRILCNANNAAQSEAMQEKDYQARIHQLEREKDILEQQIKALKKKLEASE